MTKTITMFGFLSFILFFVFIILIIGLSLLAKIIGTVIKAGKRMTGTDRTSAYEKPQDYTDSDTGYTETTSSGNYRWKSSKGPRKKIFDDDEGEYIEFEEIKD